MVIHKSPLKSIIVESQTFRSVFISRDVSIDIYLPNNLLDKNALSLLLINDGQDLLRMPFDRILDSLVTDHVISPVICVGIYSGPDRKMEYGIAAQPDYMGLGAKAGNYTKFVLQELLPFVQSRYDLFDLKEKAFAGFSLGALSAFDIVWNHPEVFTKAGLFSGAFWWRSKSYGEGYNDATDRIVLNEVRKGRHHSQLKFFFECGALDEVEDRNNNGIIDSIDDTLDLIAELKRKRYSDKAIEYLELKEGKHDIATWAIAFPYFLKWGWGKPLR